MGAFLVWSYRALIRIVIGLVCILLVLAAAWQFWVIPNIQSYRSWVTHRLEAEVGHKVSIGQLQAGWRGIRPYLQFSDFVMYNTQTEPAFRLHKIGANLAWWYLLWGEVHFSKIQVDVPNLVIRRDKQQNLWIAGVPFARDGDSNNNQWLNWVWQQGSIDISNGVLRWEDETQQTESVTLNHVDVSMERLLSRHILSASFTGTSPALTAPVALKATIYGHDFNEVASWHGNIKIDRLQGDFARLWHYVPASLQSFELQSMRGQVSTLQLAFRSLQTWDVSFTAQLNDLHMQFGEKLAPLDIAHFTGDVVLHSSPEIRRIALQQFTIKMPDAGGEKHASFFYEENAHEHLLKVQNVYLQSIWKLFPSLPQLARFSKQADIPAGLVKKADLRWPSQIQRADQIRGEVSITHAAMAIHDVLAVRNMDIDLQLKDNQGEVRLAGESVYFASPQHFVEPLRLDSAKLEAQWSQATHYWDIRIKQLEASNQDAALTLTGQYHYAADHEDWFSLQGNIARARANRVYAYLPRVLGDDVLAWLKNSLLAGEAYDTRFKVEGKLKDFPYADGEQGIFDIKGHARNVVMAYAPGWPRIENISGKLHFFGRAMEIQVDQAVSSQTRLTEVNATMADMLNDDNLLIDGKAVGATPDFLRFLRDSPLQSVLSNSKALQAKGKGALNLHLVIPLKDPEKAHVKGQYQFIDNQLDFGPTVPLLQRVSGQFSFTERDFLLDTMTAQALGGVLKAQGKTDKNGTLNVNITGRASVAQAAKQYIPRLHPQFKGDTAYRARLQLYKTGHVFELTSDMVGAAVSLPAPLMKSAEEKRTLTLYLQNDTKQLLRFQYATSLTGNLYWQDGKLQGEIRLNPADTALKQRTGLWITGHLDQFDLSEWQALFTTPRASDEDELDGVDLSITRAQGFNYQLNHLDVMAQRKGGIWGGKLKADEVAGNFSVAPDKVTVALDKLHWPFPPGETSRHEQEKSADAVSDYSFLLESDLPALSIKINDLYYQHRQLGHLTAQLTPHKQAWQLDNLHLSNPDGEVFLKGVWRYRAENLLTQGSISIKAPEFGKFLGRFVPEDLIHGGKATIQADLQWEGSPFVPDYATMEGKVQLQLEKGQFAKIDPGAGRLLGILSLQSLPRRIRLDFRDIFSEGLAFDSLIGDSRIKQGVASTDNLILVGPAARILFQGETNLAKRTQNLKVRVIPVVGDSVSLAAGVLINPVVGVGAFVIQRLFNDPLGKFVAYDYAVTGTWQDPQVARISWSEPVQNK